MASVGGPLRVDGFVPPRFSEPQVGDLRPYPRRDTAGIIESAAEHKDQR